MENRYSRLIRLRKAAEVMRGRLLALLGAHSYETEAATLADLLEDFVKAAFAVREMGLTEPHCVLPTFALVAIEHRIEELEQTCIRLEKTAMQRLINRAVLVPCLEKKKP